MRLCDVVGHTVATAKHPAFEGRTMLVCQPLDADLRPIGPVLLAVDRVQAGIGDRVLINQEGNGSRQMLGAPGGKLPIRSVIVGIVDRVDRAHEASPASARDAAELTPRGAPG
ncbi:MAG: EutN/CcmL family microcompartment protein [Myxococcales bacterium]|nr:EutN/CcmL family microcompartment protein [Myxococcales bacterium]